MNPVAGDIDINTIIDYIQHLSTGHHHDGVDSRIANGYLQLNPSGSQEYLGPTSVLGNGVVSIKIDDTNAGHFSLGASVTNVPVQFHSSGGDIYMVPNYPGIVMSGTTTNLLFPTLLALWETDVNKFFNCFFFDSFNLLGLGATTVVIGDDGFSLSGNAATGDVKFLAAAGSKVRMDSFTGGQVLPIKKVNEAAPGGANITKAITIATQADATYGVVVTPHTNDLIWVTGKGVSGFTLNYAVAGGSECDWEVFR